MSDVYYHNKYVKYFFECADCNLTASRIIESYDYMTCPLCNKILKLQSKTLEFVQTYDNATTISC